MIKVKVELHSAITGQVTSLGELVIFNDGTGTEYLGNYVTRQLSRAGNIVGRSGTVSEHPRLRESIWRLVRKSLESLGHGEK